MATDDIVLFYSNSVTCSLYSNNFFLVNLACSDLLVGFITLPISVIVHYVEAQAYRLGRVGFRYSFQFAFIISMFASVLSLAALSMDRYFAIMRPLEYRENKQLSVRPCVFISISIWIIAGSFSFLLLVTGNVTLVTIFNHTAVGVTLIILILTYIKVTKHFKSKTEENNTGENAQAKPKTSIEKRR